MNYLWFLLIFFPPAEKAACVESILLVWRHAQIFRRKFYLKSNYTWYLVLLVGGLKEPTGMRTAVAIANP